MLEYRLTVDYIEIEKVFSKEILVEETSSSRSNRKKKNNVNRVLDEC